MRMVDEKTNTQIDEMHNWTYRQILRQKIEYISSKPVIRWRSTERQINIRTQTECKKNYRQTHRKSDSQKKEIC